MTSEQLGSLLIALLVLLASAHVLGHLFSRLKQPRVIGEVLAGVLIGPSVLGRSPHFASFFSNSDPQTGPVLSFVYWMGLLLLMFTSGAEIKHLFGREDRRQVGWLVVVGTGLPFVVALVAGYSLPLHNLTGPALNRTALILVLGIAAAVTSIPVISRIFHDLRILHTRFARLVLGVAVLEDIALWAVLAIATALAKSSVLPKREITSHIAATLIYFAAGMFLMPKLLKRVHIARWNVLATASPTGYIVAILFAYCGLAALFQISLIFAAFLAGFAIAAEPELFRDSLPALHKFSFSVFVPIYFAIVGLKLDLGRNFSFVMLIIFFVAACAVKLLSVGAGAHFAGFRGRDVVNLAVATNARGGPGIVLASVAYDAGIVNAACYTTLVLLAIFTSQAAGAWLEYVLSRGWPLLSGDEVLADRVEALAPTGVLTHS
jgi:Kef-type K+ transport system membrane component KefB